MNIGKLTISANSFTNLVAKAIESVVHKGKASTHLVNISVITSTYLLLDSLTGSGPIMSHDIYLLKLMFGNNCTQ